MRRGSGHQRRFGEIAAESEQAPCHSSFPPSSSSSSSASEHLSRSSSPARKGKPSKFGCSLNAFKCSSRADDRGEHSLGEFPILSKKGYDRISDFVGTTGASPQSGSLSLPPPSPQTPHETGRQRRYSEGYESDASSRLVELTGMETIDHAPFEDFEDDEIDVQALHPSRTSSDDTHDTPNVSNRDRSHLVLPTVLTGRIVPDADFDEFCQTNFNTPRMLHTNGSLGDSITPLVSPEGQSSDEGDDEQDTRDRRTRSSLDPKTRNELQLPTMHFNRDPALRDSVLSYGSSISFLVGEMFFEEQKVAGNADHIIASEASPTHEKGDRMAPQRNDPPPQISIDEKQGYESYMSAQPEDSPCSSVSSFIEALKQKRSRTQSKSPSHPPFFWRTHPTTTVYSYDFQQPHLSTWHAVPNSNDCDDLISVDIGSPVHVARPWMKGKSTVYDPTAIREMWMMSKPFPWQDNTRRGIQSGHTNRRPQGLPSKRSAELIQSFTSLAANKFAAVFTSSDSTRLHT